MTISVRPMTPAEFDDWSEHLARRFATSQVAAGNWEAAEALDRARRGNAALLPEGLATPGMLLLIGVRADGAPVGRMWIGLAHPRGAADCAFIYDLEIDEEHRGQGHGKALLAAGEERARAYGVGAIELNVFGDNTRAIRLYETTGYVVVTQQLRKDLTGVEP